MSTRPLTHAEATAERGLRHVSEFIPAEYQRGDHFQSAMSIAKQIARTHPKGQSRFSLARNWKLHMLEGLRDA